LGSGIRFAHGELGVEFAGARLLASGTRRAQPGDTLAVRYYWRLLGGRPDDVSDLEVVALLAAPSGELRQPATGGTLLEDVHALGQGASLAQLAPGELFAETLGLRVPRSVHPGRWMLWVGVRSRAGLLATPEGSAFVRALPLELVASDAPRALWSAFRTGPPGAIQSGGVIPSSDAVTQLTAPDAVIRSGRRR
jgi:hypothetical protein